MALLMSQNEFAVRHQVGKSAVSNWKRKNLLVFAPDPKRPGKQLVDAEKSDLLVRGSIDGTRGRPRTGDQAEAAEEGGQESAAPQRGVPGMSGLDEARLADMRERTLSRQIDNQKALKQLVPLMEYERRAGDMGRLIRERAHGLIRQHGERWAAETDPRTLMSLLDQAFDGMFSVLADEIEASVTAETVVDEALAAVEASVEAEDDAEDA